jgi:hypothetical protein
MKKILLFSVLLLFSSRVISQDAIKATLININKQATVIDAALLKINSSIKTDRHAEMEQLAESIKAALNSMKKELQYLPDEYNNGLSTAVSSFQTDTDNFKKLTAKREFLDKDKLLQQAFFGLQQKQNELRGALKSAYSKALQQQEQPGMEKKPEKENVQADTMQPVRSTGANKDKEIAVASSTSDNSIILNSLHHTQQQIEGWIDSSSIAMKKSNFIKIGVYAKNMLHASLKINDLLLLLKSDRKEDLLALATGLKNLAHRFHELAHKGSAAHHELHETLEKIGIKLNSLSMGISLVQ